MSTRRESSRGARRTNPSASTAAGPLGGTCWARSVCPLGMVTNPPMNRANSAILRRVVTKFVCLPESRDRCPPLRRYPPGAGPTGARWGDAGLERQASYAGSLNNLVRPREHRWRDREAEGLRGLEVDHQVELGGLFNGQVRGFG